MALKYGNYDITMSLRSWTVYWAQKAVLTAFWVLLSVLNSGILVIVMEKYSSGWRGALAKGVDVLKRARVRIPSSPFSISWRCTKILVQRFFYVKMQYFIDFWLWAILRYLFFWNYILVLTQTVYWIREICFFY